MRLMRLMRLMGSKRPLITFATLLEAQDSLEQLKAETIEEGRLYQTDAALIAITGMGSMNAAIATARLAKEVNSVYNFGIAGSLNEELSEEISFASFHRIQTLYKNIPFPNQVEGRNQQFALSISPPLKISQEGLRLTTSDYPVYDPHTRQLLSLTSDLVDMEGYGIALACQTLNIPCYMYKIVSDFSKPDDYLRIQKEIRYLAKKLSHYVEQCMAQQ